MKKNIFVVEGKEHVYNGKVVILATFTDVMYAQLFKDAYEKDFGVVVRIVELKQ